MRLGVLCSCLIFFGLAPGGAPAQDRPFSVGYDIYAGGLHVFALDARAAVDGDGYVIETEGRSQGLLDWLFPVSAQARTSGEIVDGHARPHTFSTMGDYRGDTRSIRIRYEDMGAETVELVPERNWDDRDPPDPKVWGHALDPLSAFLAVNIGAKAETLCEWTLELFDGRRRYDLIFAPVGFDDLAASPRSDWAGEALECTVRFEDVLEREDQGEDYRPGPHSTASLWLARPEGVSYWLPVRVRAESRFGAVFAHLRLTGAEEEDHARLSGPHPPAPP